MEPASDNSCPFPTAQISAAGGWSVTRGQCPPPVPPATAWGQQVGWLCRGARRAELGVSAFPATCPGAAVVAASEGTAQAGDSDTDPCCGTGSAPPAPALCSPSARLSPAAGDGLSAHGRRTRRYNEPTRTSAFYFLPTTFSWQTRNSHYTAGERTRGESTAGNRQSRRKEPLAGRAVTPPESGTGTEPQHNHSPISPSHTGSPAPNLRRWDPSERGRAHCTGAPGAAPCPRLQHRALGLPPPAARAAARPAAGTAGTWPCSGSPSAGCGAAVGLTRRWWRGGSRGLSPSCVGGTGQDSLCCQTPVTNYGSAPLPHRDQSPVL